MKRLILFIAAILFLNNCDAGKRIARICARNPGVCDKDSVTYFVRDSIVIPAIRVDTTFLLSHSFDTVYIQKDGLLIKHHYNPHTNKISVSGHMPAQTHVFEHKITVVNNAVKFKKDWMDYFAFVFTFIAGAIFVIPVVLGILRKITRKNESQ